MYYPLLYSAKAAEHSARYRSALSAKFAVFTVPYKDRAQGKTPLFVAAGATTVNVLNCSGMKQRVVGGYEMSE